MTPQEEHFGPLAYTLSDFDPSADAPIFPEWFGHQASLHFVPVDGLSSLAWVYHYWTDEGEREWDFEDVTDSSQRGAILNDDGSWTRLRYWLAVLPGRTREFALVWHEMEATGLGARIVKRTRSVSWRADPNVQSTAPDGFDASDPLTWPRIGGNGWYLRATAPGSTINLRVSFPSVPILHQPWYLTPPHDGIRLGIQTTMPGLVRPFAELYRPVCATLPSHILSLPTPLI